MAFLRVCMEAGVLIVIVGYLLMLKMLRKASVASDWPGAVR
jgi:hypothetical protein